MHDQEHLNWAQQEFAYLDLGHLARKKCACRVLSYLSRATGSKVTQFTRNNAELQQAYGLIGHEQILPVSFTQAAAQAAYKRMEPQSPWCIVPLDGSSLNLTDPEHQKGFGQVGGSPLTRGLIVQTALAVSNEGVPLGVLAQHYLARPDSKNKGKSKSQQKRSKDKETKYSLEIIQTVEASTEAAEKTGRLWFQMDRGYDCMLLLEHMAESPNRFTIRGEYDRALWVDEEDEASVENEESHKSVMQALAACPVVAELELSLKGSPTRTAREARLEVRYSELTLRLSDPTRRQTVRSATGKSRRVPIRWPRTLNCVWVQEVSAVPEGETPLRWLLWTNAELNSGEDALEVVTKYSYRWLVEEFHRLWKSGAMKVEETQVRALDHAERIARMSALVACRLLRLARLARDQEDSEASEEFSPAELTLLHLLDPRSPRQAPRPQRKGSLAWVIAVLADLGGYTGKSSGGPPGPLVLARGMKRLANALEGFEAAQRIRDQC
jgi:ferredoxin